MEGDYKDRLESIELNISDSEGLEKAKEIAESLEYIIELDDDFVYPFVIYLQESIEDIIEKYNLLKAINYELRNELFFALILSLGLNLAFIIYYLKG
jgi:hypothetical protein